MSTASNASPPYYERDEFKCPLCWEFAAEPFCLKPCNHFVCNLCLHGLRGSRYPNRCPFCRGTVKKWMHHVEMELKMAQLEEECPGCQEMLTLPNMKRHLKTCPTLVHLEKYSIQINKRMIRLWKLPSQRGLRHRYNNMPRNQGSKWREPHNEQENHEEVTTVQRINVQHQSDVEVNDEPRSQDYQPARHIQHEVTHSSIGQESGSWERDERSWQQIFTQSHWNSLHKKGAHARAPAPSRSKASDDKEAPTRNSAMATESGVSSASENASAPNRMSTEKNNASRPWSRRAQFQCPSCKEFTNEPLCLKACGHFMCKSCIQSLKESNYPTYCPVCRRGLAKDQSYQEMELRMALWKGKCPGCQEMFPLSVMKQHVMNCPTLVRMEEYSEHSDDEAESAVEASQMTGMESVAPLWGARPKDQPNEKRSCLKEAHTGNLTKATVSVACSASKTDSAPSSIQSDRPRYECPYCRKPVLSQLELVNHCLYQHAYERRRVVCPVCASSKWGNPNKLSANFIMHLRIKHGFHYKNDLPAEEDEEEAMIAKALDASLRYF